MGDLLNPGDPTVELDNNIIKISIASHSVAWFRRPDCQLDVMLRLFKLLPLFLTTAK